MNNIKLALVGKINEAYDSYSKVKEAVNHAASYLHVKVEILWIDSVIINDNNVQETLEKADGIILLGGFGERGVEGMIVATKYARENNIPILGICLGMQIMVIEFARNVLGYKNATSTEFNEITEYPVIHKISNENKPLREGTFVCSVDNDSLAYQIYEQNMVEECFRHGYEFNLDYEKQYLAKSMRISGHLLEEDSIEIVELPQNNFYIGVQYHPEFKSSSLNPHPLFIALIKECSK